MKEDNQGDPGVGATAPDMQSVPTGAMPKPTPPDATFAHDFPHPSSPLADFASFANLDFKRAERCGFPEVVYGEYKTAKQVVAIAMALVAQHGVAMVTRANAAQADALAQVAPDAHFVPSCGILYLDRRPSPLAINGSRAVHILNGSGGAGQVLVCCAGTSDLPVAEEAAITARIMGSRTTLLVDVGVAGVHRLLEQIELLQSARAIVAVAGMEGALPSLLAGLVAVPVIAVPTSIGYGASFGGLAALLGMLNSCAGGVSVVNIDNGFDAGLIAHRINQPSGSRPLQEP
ncbi:MAG: nickel pincer cofactor biosynthesis protein LarB [Coriobacteriales bacterium]|nr:nickel pincer cofactor biosynthesis protein LarB [Coriobacteriales bacterium]